MRSRPVHSNQPSLNERLESVVVKHAASDFKKPVSENSARAFDVVTEWLRDRKGPLILDSGCGIGASVLQLARLYPDAFVLGIDKSAHRLAKNFGSDAPVTEDNWGLVRADLVDFWRLAAQARWKIRRHYILYPNPWPKKSQLLRRWHGHPVFPTLARLGGIVELRTNWDVYAREFAKAWNLVCNGSADTQCFTPDELLTPFERKYHLSGHSLFRTICTTHDTRVTERRLTTDKRIRYT